MFLYTDCPDHKTYKDVKDDHCSSIHQEWSYRTLSIFTLTLIYLARVKNERKNGGPTTSHGTSPPRRSGNPELLASYIMNLFPLGRTDAQDPWASTDPLNAGGTAAAATEYFLHGARCMQNASKYAMARTDRAEAAPTPVRPPTRGDGRMRGGFSYRLAPRWRSESPHTQKACILRVHTPEGLGCNWR